MALDFDSRWQPRSGSARGAPNDSRGGCAPHIFAANFGILAHQLAKITTTAYDSPTL
jgi:hypothetical protein